MNVDLSNKDRKLLWSRAAGRCSYRYESVCCNKELFVVNGQMASNLGQECHIVGEKQQAARYVENFPTRESYDNAILLCSEHHKLVDDNPSIYTRDLLIRMKNAHEAAVSASLGKGELLPFVLKDTNIALSAENVDSAIGADIRQPTLLSNVKVAVTANNVESVTGIRISNGLTAQLIVCPNCSRPFGRTYSGQKDLWRKECPYCKYVLE